jgi:phospholipid transport system substrate-binding protein
MTPPRTLPLFALLALLLAGPALALTEPVAPVAPTTLTPDQLVRRTSDTVIAKVQANRAALERDIKRIYRLVETDILPYSDFSWMARQVLGRHWDGASPEQQQDFILQFQQLLIRTYATALLKYAESTVEYLPYREQPGAVQAVIRTRVGRIGPRPFAIDYLLRLQPELGWRLVDIKIDGVSLVSNYRSSFAREIGRGGLEPLLVRMRKRNQELSADPLAEPQPGPNPPPH